VLAPDLDEETRRQELRTLEQQHSMSAGDPLFVSFRRLLIRWDKKPANYLAFLHFACGLIAFRAAGLFG